MPVVQFSRKLFTKHGRRASARCPSRLADDSKLHVPTATTSTGDQSVGSSSTPFTNAEAEDKKWKTKSTTSEHNTSEHSSATSQALHTRERVRVSDRASDTQGLNLLHAPAGPHLADIIFVHGLGGSSRLSWSKNKDLALFWPQEWLPLDADVHQARIFTFGYNASFLSTTQAGSIGIMDFAKNLLYDMLYGRDSQGGSLHLGRVRTP